ncbi:MAG: CoA-transferase [Arenicellales bacterium]|jgi:glutaconate CoA-transferase subunit A|nr:CoA-transferase [Arenicellales bacterium]
MVEVVDLETLVTRITDGTSIALPPDYSGCAMSAVRLLIERGVTDLRVITVPQGGLQVDLLIGAGCVSVLESAAVTLGEHGLAPRFTDAMRTGSIHMRESTCPAIHAGLQAAEKGLPFMPLRGIIGSDLVRYRPDWIVQNNPFADDDPIVLLPAIRPNVALFHAPLADTDGNVWVGIRRELMTMAHAAESTLVTVEEIVSDSLLADERTAAGVIPSMYIHGVSVVEKGAWPVGLWGCYAADHDHLQDYVRRAITMEGFNEYLSAYGHESAAASTP